MPENSTTRGIDTAALIHATLQTFQMKFEDVSRLVVALINQRQAIMEAGEKVGEIVGEVIETVLTVHASLEGKPATRGLNPYHQEILEHYATITEAAKQAEMVIEDFSE